MKWLIAKFCIHYKPFIPRTAQDVGRVKAVILICRRGTGTCVLRRWFLLSPVQLSGVAEVR